MEENVLTLNNAVIMPKIGFGTYQLPPSQTEKVVLDAISAGYRHIDTAQYYGNEHEIGLAVKRSGIPRDHFFITSKTATSGYAATKRGIDRSLKAFGFDYIDMMIIHWPTSDNSGTYRALVEAYHNKKVRAIGVSNFNIPQIETLLKDFDVIPVVDQIETHVLWQQKRMHKYLVDHNIVHESWSPFAQGMDDIFRNPTLTQIARSHHKTVSQVILRFLLQSDVAVIPKTTNVQHMKENIDVFDFTLNSEEMQQIQTMDIRKSYTGWPSTMRE